LLTLAFVDRAIWPFCGVEDEIEELTTDTAITFVRTSTVT